MNYELPKFNGPVDHLRQGFKSLETEFNASHPIDTLQQNEYESNLGKKIMVARKIHGSGFAMRLAMDHAMMNRQRRLPGLQSSTIFQDTVSGNDTKIGFEDFLNDPLERPDIPKLSIHDHMEVKFGLM